ncbi:uncharacterized, partial [Tachysurus ichikawai]
RQTENDAFMKDDTSVFVSSSEDRVCARVTLQELTVQHKGLWGQVAMMALVWRSPECT